MGCSHKVILPRDVEITSLFLYNNKPCMHRRIEFWFCLGGRGLILSVSYGGPGAYPAENFLKLGALKLHFQHSENTFGEIFYIFKTTFFGAFSDKSHKHTNSVQHLFNTT